MRYANATREYFVSNLARASGWLETELVNNDRLKWILITGAFILYVSLVLFIAERADYAQNRYTSTQARYIQLESQVTDHDWKERADTTTAYANSLQTRFWQGDTPGLAEAGFERWIRQTLDRHGIEVRQVQLTRGPLAEELAQSGRISLSSVERIRAKVIGPLNEAAIILFLNDVASHESWIIVEQFVARGGRSDRFEIDLATFYKP